MKALSKLKAETGIWMTDAPKPEVGHNDLLIKIRKTAICGTDVHIYNWDEWAQNTIPVPMVVVGHEYVGEVVDMGQEVRGFEVGDRFLVKVILPVVIVVIVAPGVYICVVIPQVWALTVKVALRNTWLFQRSMPLRSPIISPMSWPLFLTRLATLYTLLCRSIWSVKMY